MWPIQKVQETDFQDLNRWYLGQKSFFIKNSKYTVLVGTGSIILDQKKIIIWNFFFRGGQPIYIIYNHIFENFKTFENFCSEFFLEIKFFCISWHQLIVWSPWHNYYGTCSLSISNVLDNIFKNPYKCWTLRCCM